MSEEKQQKLMQLQFIHQQLRMLQQQLQQLEQQAMELEQTKINIKELAQVEKGTGLYVPLASGVYAKAQWDTQDQFLINVGAGAAVPKSAEDVAHLIEEQQREAEKMRDEMTQQAQKLIEQAQALEGEL